MRCPKCKARMHVSGKFRMCYWCSMAQIKYADHRWFTVKEAYPSPQPPGKSSSSVNDESHKKVHD